MSDLRNPDMNNFNRHRMMEISDRRVANARMPGFYRERSRAVQVN